MVLAEDKRWRRRGGLKAGSGSKAGFLVLAVCWRKKGQKIERKEMKY